MFHFRCEDEGDDSSKTTAKGNSRMTSSSFLVFLAFSVDLSRLASNDNLNKCSKWFVKWWLPSTTRTSRVFTKDKNRHMVIWFFKLLTPSWDSSNVLKPIVVNINYDPCSKLATKISRIKGMYNTLIAEISKWLAF